MVLLAALPYCQECFSQSVKTFSGKEVDAQDDMGLGCCGDRHAAPATPVWAIYNAWAPMARSLSKMLVRARGRRSRSSSPQGPPCLPPPPPSARPRLRRRRRGFSVNAGSAAPRSKPAAWPTHRPTWRSSAPSVRANAQPWPSARRWPSSGARWWAGCRRRRLPRKWKRPRKPATHA